MRPVAGTITDPTFNRELRHSKALLDLARALARVVHAGQTRKGTGEPYIQHLNRVAARVSPRGLRAQTVAFLHDTIEDTAVTVHTLMDIGFPADIVIDVQTLTRRSDETYREFIAQTIRYGSDDTLAVKEADLLDNLHDPWASQTTLVERYRPALRDVQAEIESRRAA